MYYWYYFIGGYPWLFRNIEGITTQGIHLSIGGYHELFTSDLSAITLLFHPKSMLSHRSWIYRWIAISANGNPPKNQLSTQKNMKFSKISSICIKLLYVFIGIWWQLKVISELPTFNLNHVSQSKLNQNGKIHYIWKC